MSKNQSRTVLMTMVVGALFSTVAWGQGIEGALAELVRYPDMIIHNGKIVTMDDRSTDPNPGAIAQAMAITEGEILALANNDRVMRLKGPNTLVVDLNGRTVIPGIIDTHSHYFDYALEHYVDKSGYKIVYTRATSNADEWLEEVRKTLQETLEQSKPGEWIRVTVPWGKDQELRQKLGRWIGSGVITRADLNRMAPRNPVMIRAGSSVLFNSNALEAYSAAFTPSKRFAETGLGGVYQRRFIEHGVVHTLDELVEMYKSELYRYASLGITTWSSSVQLDKTLKVYTLLDRKDEMPIRFAWGHGIATSLETSEATKFFEHIGDTAGYGSDYLWQVGVTLVSVNSLPRDVGSSQLALGKPRRQLMYAAIKHGLRMSNLHLIGDTVLDHYLDIIEEASKEAGFRLEQIREKRHVIDHCDLNPRPDQIARLKKLGIIASCSPKYIWRDAAEHVERYGRDVEDWIVPAKSLIDGGVRTVFELDVPFIGDRNAFFFLERLVTREGWDGNIYAPKEKIDRITALKTATMWAAEYVLREDLLGSLERGKFADFLVLNKDYFTVQEKEISTVRPLMTVVGGNIVFLDRELAEEAGWEPVEPEEIRRMPLTESPMLER